LPIFQDLDELSFEKNVTIFVGENGSGKSTLLKGLALAMNLPVIGSIDLDLDDTLASLMYFSDQIHGSWSDRVYNGFFFRAEDYFGFVKRLRKIDDELANDIVDFEKQLSGTGLKRAVG
jgi:predicted ATPase